MDSRKGREHGCYKRLYLSAHSAAVTHPLPWRQHFLTERRVARREIKSKALLLFLEHLIYT